MCCVLDAGPPSPADHLRDVFYRMGLDDKVVLILFHVKHEYSQFLTVEVVLSSRK